MLNYIQQEVEKDKSLVELIQKENAPLTIDDCLKDFTQPEKLVGDDLYYCSKCKVLILPCQSSFLTNAITLAIALFSLYTSL